MISVVKDRLKKVRKLPRWVIMIPVLIVKFSKFCMRTEIKDPFNVLGTNTPENPAVAVAWHNRILFFPIMFPVGIRSRTRSVISASRDGEYIADMIRMFGLESIRGSGSRRGAAVLLESISALKDGFNVAFTPDGPRGPKYEINRGPVVVASMTGRPVIPISINSSSFISVISWDNFQIPMPWSKTVLVLGEPVHVPPDLSEEQIDEWCKILSAKLMEITDDSGSINKIHRRYKKPKKATSVPKEEQQS